MCPMTCCHAMEHMFRIRPSQSSLKMSTIFFIVQAAHIMPPHVIVMSIRNTMLSCVVRITTDDVFRYSEEWIRSKELFPSPYVKDHCLLRTFPRGIGGVLRLACICFSRLHAKNVPTSKGINFPVHFFFPGFRSCFFEKQCYIIIYIIFSRL